MRNSSVSLKNKGKNMIRIINLKSFFIDYLKINFVLPVINVTAREKENAIKTGRELLNGLKKRVGIWTENYPECAGIFVQIDKFHNLQIDFKGSFFINGRNYREDLKNFENWYSEILNMVNVGWMLKMNKPLEKPTIARIDLATQKKGSFTDDYVAIPSSRNTDIVNTWVVPFHGKNLMSGITIAPEKGRETENIYFRAYDKKMNKKGIDVCYRRFGSVDFIRKEWMLKNRFLRNNGIRTVEDMYSVAYNRIKFTELIKKFRKSKDVLLKTDSMLYKSLHDLNAREFLRGKTEMSIKEFEKLYQKKYGIFLNKANKDDIREIKWNPYKQIKGLIKYVDRMSHSEFLDVQESLVNGIMKEVYSNYIWSDHETDYYEMMVQLLNDLKKLKMRSIDIERTINGLNTMGY